ncbi:MAG: PQQ-dependent sugar dehydrogenase, partial [Acidimicrobiales bacterium]
PTPSRAAADRTCDHAYVVPQTVVMPRDEQPRVIRVGCVDDGATALAFWPGGDRGVIASRVGEVMSLTGGLIDSRRPVIDLTNDTQTEGDGGLLGLAYSPAGDWLYVYRSDADKDEVVTAYPVDEGRPDPGGQRVILEIDHPPSEQHHGGGFAFGPDGYLYIGTGDGGGLGDPRGNGQRLGTLLGKVLRIDPTPEGPEPYRVPGDNPFVERAGARAEIWAYGLRNPFRLSFDPVTGDVWVGDVGQSCWEELNRLPAGAGGLNLGWDRREGTHRFEGGRIDGAVDPVHAYSHRGGHCAVVAGFVYHALASPLDGTVLYTDFCAGALRALEYRPGEAVVVHDLGLTVDQPVAIVAGPDGEPWVLSLDGAVYRLQLTGP